MTSETIVRTIVLNHSGSLPTACLVYIGKTWVSRQSKKACVPLLCCIENKTALSVPYRHLHGVSRTLIRKYLVTMINLMTTRLYKFVCIDAGQTVKIQFNYNVHCSCSNLVIRSFQKRFTPLHRGNLNCLEGSIINC